MARLSLTKASLTKEKKRLKNFQAVLPSLDLKRRQLSAEREKAKKLLAAIQKQLGDIEPEIGREIPMLSNDLVDLTDIVKVASVKIGEENVMGTRLPQVQQVEIAAFDYGLLGKPFWVDRLVQLLKIALKTQIRLQIARRRLELIEKAERTVTQRFNLFDKVLIPRTKKNIKKIGIYLADTERAGVVQAKIAKRKKQREAA